MLAGIFKILFAMIHITFYHNPLPLKDYEYVFAQALDEKLPDLTGKYMPRSNDCQVGAEIRIYKSTGHNITKKSKLIIAYPCTVARFNRLKKYSLNSIQ